jgi:hypothetical protein
MTGDEELALTLDELDRVRKQTRAAVHPAWFPLLLFGVLGLASIPFGFIADGVGTGLFWLVAGPAGGFACAHYYRDRAFTLGAGVRGRAYTVLGVILFVAAWLAGFVTESAAGPMLVVALGYIGFAWLDRSWPTAAVAAVLGVSAVVVVATGVDHADIILALVFGLGFTATGLLLRRRDPAA